MDLGESMQQITRSVQNNALGFPPLSVSSSFIFFKSMTYYKGFDNVNKDSDNTVTSLPGDNAPQAINFI